MIPTVGTRVEATSYQLQSPATSYRHQLPVTVTSYQLQSPATSYRHQLPSPATVCETFSIDVAASLHSTVKLGDDI